MPSLYLLIPIALLFVGLAAVLYWWAVRSGQYRDLDREADRILYHEPDPSKRQANDISSTEEGNDKP